MIGYSYGVGQSGTVYEGCGLHTRPIHSPPRNSDAWGVVYLQPSTAQGVLTAPMSQAMKNSGRALYEWLCGQAGRRLHMSFHSQHWATSCPGPDIRAWVQAGMPAQAAPAPTPEREEDKMRGVWALNADGRPQYFSLSQGGRQVHSQWMQTNGQWSGWRRIGGATEHPAFVSLEPTRHQNGRLEITARTGDDRTFIIHQQSPNGHWFDRFRQW